jgi:hypothetical protein
VALVILVVLVVLAVLVELVALIVLASLVALVVLAALVALVALVVLVAATNRIAECKTQLSFQSRNKHEPPLTEAQCIRQLKRWLVAGLPISSDEPRGKFKHMQHNPRDVGAQSVLEDLETPPVVLAL